MSGHWTRGRRRNQCDAAALISGLVTKYGARGLARLAGVSDRTVRRWASGEDWPPFERLVELLDRLWPQGRHALPIYRPDMALDGRSRVGGVGDYSIRSAQGGQGEQR